MDFEDDLPCGGYDQEDAKIKKAMRQGNEENETKEECCNKEERGCECKEQSIPNPMKKTDKVCHKCKERRPVLMQKGDPVCEPCLFKNMEYKCRLLLENTLKVKKTDNLLLCLSGGLNSICLVEIMVNIMRRYQRNKLFNRLGVVHVQQQESMPQGYRERFEKDYGIELTVIPVQTAIEADEVGKVKQVLGLFGPSANSLDLLSIFRDRLIRDFATREGFSHIIKGDNAERIACQTFKLFAVGQGGDIGSIICQPNSQTVYPLKGILQKQLQYYFYRKSLGRWAIKWQADNAQYSVSTGIDGQLRSFIGNLQQMYSHTSPAIVRTMEKIIGVLPNGEKCQWCDVIGTDEGKVLCRRCWRLWEGRRKGIKVTQLPKWMIFQE